MRIAYTTTFDANDVHNWSGTPYHMSHAFTQAGDEVNYIGSLKRETPPFFKLKQVWQKYISRNRISPRFNTYIAQHYSRQVEKQLKNISVDYIVSPLINPISYLDCKQPIILWTDALYASLLGFYPPFGHHSAETITQGNAMTSACLSRCALAIFSSEWAARSALELYGADRNKVQVVPFGANITAYPSFTEVTSFIEKRSSHKIKLLFLAKSWERKGGDIVVAVAKALHTAGYQVELNIVGYQPNIKDLLDYIHCLGFISKHTIEGKQRLNELLASSHFLFVPSRAEAFGIVYCEANAFGVPCLTTYVGGIGSVVRDHINGMTFALDASVETYVNYIAATVTNQKVYKELALSSYNEFITRLNWPAAVKRVRELIKSM